MVDPFSEFKVTRHNRVTLVAARDIFMNLMPKAQILIKILLVVLPALCIGCGEDPATSGQLAGLSDGATSGISSAPDAPVLTCSHQIYDSAGAREVHAVLNDPEFSDIKLMLENAFSDASSPRARVILSRNLDSGHVIALTKEPTGELELAVTTKIDGHWFEANESNIDSLPTACSVFRAFNDHDANIETVIKWDEIVK